MAAVPFRRIRRRRNPGVFGAILTLFLFYNILAVKRNNLGGSDESEEVRRNSRGERLMKAPQTYVCRARTCVCMLARVCMGVRVCVRVRVRVSVSVRVSVRMW